MKRDIPFWVIAVTAGLLVIANRWYHHFYDEGLLVRGIASFVLVAWITVTWFLAQRPAKAPRS